MDDEEFARREKYFSLSYNNYFMEDMQVEDRMSGLYTAMFICKVCGSLTTIPLKHVEWHEAIKS